MKNKNIRDLNIISPELLNFDEDFVLKCDSRNDSQSKVKLRNLQNQFGDRKIKIIATERNLATNVAVSAGALEKRTYDLTKYGPISAASILVTCSCSNTLKENSFNFSYYAGKNHTFRHKHDIYHINRKWLAVNIQEKMPVLQSSEFIVPAVSQGTSSRNRTIFLSFGADQASSFRVELNTVFF